MDTAALSELTHLLRVQALTLAEQTRANEVSRQALLPLVDAVERMVRGLRGVDYQRARQALGEVRHALGIEVRDDVPPLVALVHGVAVVDVGMPPGPRIALLLILDRGRMHLARLTATQVEELRGLATEDMAVGEIGIWAADDHHVASMIAAAGLAVEVFSVALAKGLQDG